MITPYSLLRAVQVDALDARVLLRTVLGVDDAFLIAHAHDAVSDEHAARFHALAARRAAGEPVAYLVREREFYGRMFTVSPAVLIPRPETELLVELALARLPQQAMRAVLDLGTGSGCIAISLALERRRTRVIASDRSSQALAIARANAQCLAADNVTFAEGSWYEALGDKRFDLILSNPPYIAVGDTHLQQGDLRFEPAAALVASGDGLHDIRIIVAGARVHLAPGGWLLFEHGYDQAARCRALLSQAGFNDVLSWRDLAGIERVSGGCAPPL